VFISYFAPETLALKIKVKPHEIQGAVPLDQLAWKDQSLILRIPFLNFFGSARAFPGKT
jgi:hypothetical protein